MGIDPTVSRCEIGTLVGAFNQEKAIVGAFSVIVKTGCGTDWALHSTIYNSFLPFTFHQDQKDNLI